MRRPLASPLFSSMAGLAALHALAVRDEMFVIRESPQLLTEDPDHADPDEKPFVESPMDVSGAPLPFGSVRNAAMLMEAVGAYQDEHGRVIFGSGQALMAFFNATVRDVRTAADQERVPNMADLPAEVEKAYWRFDERVKGYGEFRGAPMGEREAFTVACAWAVVRCAGYPKLDRPAAVGAFNFHPGVSSRLVVERAQREYELRETQRDEKEQSRDVLLSDLIARATGAT